MSGTGGTYTRSGDALHQRLTVAVDAGIAATILLAPLFMGGRGPVGRFVFVLCVAITAIFWCARQCVSEHATWRKSGAEWLLLAGLGLLIFQLVPLPYPILSLVSPRLSELLPLWTSSGDASFQLGTWSQVSLHPVATQSGLATYVAYAVLFFVVYQRFETRHDVERLLRLIAVSTCLMAALGLAQFLFGNGKFLWVFEHVSRDTHHAVKGPFQNQNHFAHLLALGIGPLLWWMSSIQTNRGNDRARTAFRSGTNPAIQSQVLWIGIGVVTFAALLTFSRGGVIAVLLAAVTSLALLSWKRLLSKRDMTIVALVAVLLVISLTIHGFEPLARKLGTFRDSQTIDELSHGRWVLWSAHFKAVPDFLLLGSGVGTHRDIYPTYMAEQFDVEFTHGECGPLQLLLETGLLGIGLFIGGLVFAFRWTVLPFLRHTDHATTACLTAIVPGVLASIVHSLGDFVWYIPACMTTTVMLLASACYLFHNSSAVVSDASPANADHTRRYLLSRPAWVGLSLVAILALGSAVNSLAAAASAAPRWYAYLRLAKTSDSATWEPTSLEDLSALSSHAEATVKTNPNDARAHAQLAGLLLQQFDVVQQSSQNPMPLSQIRDAALASAFSSKQQQDEWLDVAVGENRRLFDSALLHAQRSVHLCPLQGEAYALLARVAFLEGPDAERKKHYVDQALRVRPFHSRVQFVAGQESLLSGNIDEAIAHWKTAFHGEREVQDELIRELTGVIPAKDLLTALAPDKRGLEALLSHYKRTNEVESAKVVAGYYTHYLAEQFKSNSELNRLRVLTRLSELHEYLESQDEAIRLAQEATGLAPADFKLKLRLGRLLVRAGRFPEAQRELEWCARRQPDHAEALKLLAAANRGTHLQQADISSADRSHNRIRQ